MKIKECYVSSHGISCITNINTLHNLKYNVPLIPITNILPFLCLRMVEFIITDFLKNYKNLDFSRDNELLNAIIFS